MNVNCLVFGLTGTICNIICLVLGYFVKNEDMKQIKKLLMLYCCCDVFYSFFHLLAQPGITLSSNIYLLFSYGIWQNVLTAKILLCIQTFFFIQSITIVMVLFVYRYRIVSSFFLPRSDGSCFMGFLLFTTITLLPLVYCVPSLWSTWNNPGISKNEMKLTLETAFDSSKLEDYVHIATFGCKIGNIDSFEKYFVIVAFSIGFSVTSFECSIIVYCGIKIASAIDIPFLSAKTKSIQKQLFYYLMTQTSITLSCCGFPVILFVIATYFNISLGPYGTLSTGMLAWFPTFDAAVLVFSVTVFRDQLLKLMKRKSESKTSPSNSVPFVISIL